jgi:hypothetical protein
MSTPKRLTVRLFKHGGGEFISLLDKAGIEYRDREYAPGTVLAASETIELVKALAGLSLFPSISMVIVQWLKNKVARKVIIQTSDNQIVHVEGVDIDERKLASLLELTSSITVVQTKPDDEQTGT